jgi:hypothetical protein
MSLFKSRVGRRVAAVGAGVGLLVLGLQAPAFAAPTVSGVSPNTGPDDCAVVITGTGFLDVPQANQDLTFVGPVAGAGDDEAVADANWFALSATEIWAVVPDLTPGTTYAVTLTDPTGGTTTGSFASTSGAGGCAPTITKVTPNCGAAFDTIVIEGTNLIGPDLLGAETRFSPYADAQIASHLVPDVDEPTSISVIVPSGSTDGKIRVTTFDTVTDDPLDPATLGVQGGIAFSPEVFDISDACAPVTGNERSVTLKLKGHLTAKGAVKVTDDTSECESSVAVKIQRKKPGGGWKTLKSTTTSDTGTYSKKIKDKPGKYRALAPAVTLESGEECAKAKSPTRKHSH